MTVSRERSLWLLHLYPLNNEISIGQYFTEKIFTAMSKDLRETFLIRCREDKQID